MIYLFIKFDDYKGTLCPDKSPLFVCIQEIQFSVSVSFSFHLCFNYIRAFKSHKSKIQLLILLRYIEAKSNSFLPCHFKIIIQIIILNKICHYIFLIKQKIGIFNAWDSRTSQFHMTKQNKSRYMYAVISVNGGVS